MNKDKNTFIAKVALIAIIVIVVFFLGRMSKKDQVKIIEPNISGFQRKEDSLMRVILLSKDSIKVAYRAIDSIKSQKVINKKKVKNGIIQITNFTPSSRDRWHDSVMRSAGLR